MVMPYAQTKRLIIRSGGILMLILFTFLSVARAELPLDPKAGTLPKVEMVWPEIVGDSYHIFYSALNDNHTWTSKIQISAFDALNLAPAIASGANGITWVVWTVVEGANSKLAYSFFNGEKWSQPKRMTSSLSSNTGPSIFVDGDNTPWVVWAGFDGSDDDIYFSTWNRDKWGTPERIHADNDVPDLLPRIALSGENDLSVYWNGFADGTYQLYMSTWDEEQWTDKRAIDRQAYRAALRADTLEMPAIPNFVPEPKKAAIHVRMAVGESISIPLRDIK